MRKTLREIKKLYKKEKALDKHTYIQLALQNDINQVVVSVLTSIDVYDFVIKNPKIDYITKQLLKMSGFLEVFEETYDYKAIDETWLDNYEPNDYYNVHKMMNNDKILYRVL